MAFKFGNLAVFQLDSGAGTLVDLSAYMNSIDGVPGGIDNADTTTFGDTAHVITPGLKEAAKVQIAGPYDPALNTHMTTLWNNGGGLTAGNASLSFEYGPNGSTSGNPKYTGECFLTNYAVTSKPDAPNEWKAELTVTNGVTLGTYA